MDNRGKKRRVSREREMRVVEGSFNFLEYLFSSGMGSNRSTDEREVGPRLRFFCFFSPSCVCCVPVCQRVRQRVRQRVIGRHIMYMVILSCAKRCA